MEAIHKLQPNRTIQLRGFDDRGASGALHSCTETGFKVTGSFTDSADFCVLMLFDADANLDHPRLRPLPDFEFSGVRLAFTVAYTGLIGLSSSLYPTIDWPYLDILREDGTTYQHRLVPADGSAGPWTVTVDFSAIGVTRIRQMWLTFAPPIPSGAAYPGGEWEATFTSWTVTGANATSKVAGLGSVRIDSADAWCTYAGSWTTQSGFFSRGFARATSSGSLTVRLHCQSSFDLYLGSALYLDRGVFGVSIDGGPEFDLSCYLNSATEVVTRRLLRAGLAPGQHIITLRHKSGGPVYFDYLEAAVPTDVPDPETVWTDRAPAHDYGTDHTYKLPPSRLLWALDRLGLQGPMNVYVSVFWWNQRKASGRVLPSASVVVPGAAVVPGQNVFVSVSGNTWGRYVIGGDTASVVAAAIAASINLTAVGVWAAAVGDTITVTNRAATSAYQFDLTAWYETPSRVDIPISGALRGGTPATWVIDETVTPTLNAGAGAWLADLCRECASRGRELTLAYSMELLNPPAAWAARYPDGTAVTTATGFSTNFTTHCTFGEPGLVDYQQRVYAETAGIMAAAGLTPRLQMGEFVWWFFADHGGMGYYDDATKADARIALGRDLQTFTGPDNPPVAADVSFLAERLVEHCRAIRDHVRGTYPTAQFEILLPLDVNYPEAYSAVSGLSGLPYSLGGRLNHAVNVPAAFLDPATAPFDQVKMEALDFGAGSRNLDRAVRTLRFPYTEGRWPKQSCRYLIPWFNGGCPWTAELAAALDEGLTVNWWAWDHLCLFGWDVPATIPRPTAQAL